MSKPKIFISHSAHQDPDKQILDELVTRLEAAGFLVYCDRQRLKPGHIWRHELYSAIGCCHAAVVLVTKEALDVVNHPWVFKECAMLTMLKWRDKAFPVFPVAMTGVTTDEIKKSPFEALHINEIQLGSHENLDQVINAITERLPDIKCSDEDEPLYHHHKRIEVHLRSINDSDALKEAIECTHCELDTWDPLDKKIRYRLARILLTLDSTQVIETLRGVLPSLDEQRSTTLIYFLAPFWLDLPAIARMDDVVQREQEMIQSDASVQNQAQPRTAFGLNARDPVTAQLHACRAGYLGKDPYLVILLPEDAGTDDEGRYASHIIAKINKRAGRSGRSNQTLDYVVISLAIEQPIFVVVPYGTAKEVIANLRKRFWPFIFIVLTGPDKPSDWEDISEFEMMEPRLEARVEDQTCLLTAKAILKATTIINGS